MEKVSGYITTDNLNIASRFPELGVVSVRAPFLSKYYTAILVLSDHAY